jgi:hypothetical protein
MILSNESLTKCQDIFLRHPRYGLSDNAIEKLLKQIPLNQKIEDVLLKTTVIKTLYSTPIFDVINLSNHILSIKNIDDMLLKGDLSIVDKIRLGHGIKTQGGKEYDFYSFATKYCSFHNPSKYPIYDNMVSDFIKSILLSTGMIKGKKALDLKIYDIYKNTIDLILERFGVTIQDYKKIDMGLWVLSKYFYKNKRDSNKDDLWIYQEIEKEFGHYA